MRLVRPAIVKVYAKKMENKPILTEPYYGVVLENRRIVLTSYALTEGASNVVVEFPDNRRITCDDVKGDLKTDIAVIKIPGNDDLAFLGVSDQEHFKNGTEIMCVSINRREETSAIAGMISGSSEPEGGGTRRIFLDLSRGPSAVASIVIDSRGELVGFVGHETPRTEQERIRPFAMPYDEVEKIVAKLLDTDEM